MRGSKASTIVFLSPWILSFLVFSAYPIVYSFFLSLTSFDPLQGHPPSFIGLSNYLNAFRNPAFWTSLKVTLIFVLGTIPVTTVLSFFIAALLTEKIPFRGTFRAGFFVPTVVSMVVIAMIFKQLYSPSGYVNILLRNLGFHEVSWLENPRTALPSIMLMDIWSSVGYYVVIFLAGIQSISKEVFESASLEGAGWFRKHVSITLPLVKPVLLFIIVINGIRSFQVFIEIFVMTRGGPLKSTLTTVYYLYDEAFYRFNMGYASAVAYILFMIILVFSIAQMKYLRMGKID
ncbi:MAG: sugar ABC transporter permease [Candidatus Eisenbacteria bacterium]|nr:sugar ABC transporter permease [Candidatus Eisenbacteria bacterium]